MNENLSLKEKLDQIKNNCPDVRRSQIRCYIPNWEDYDTLSALFYEPEKYRTFYFDDICDAINEIINSDYNSNAYWDEKEYHNIEFYKEFIEGMYNDSINNIWGFVYDW